MESASFLEWLDRFSGYLRMRNYSPRTIKKYDQTVQRFARYAWLRQHRGPDGVSFDDAAVKNAPLDADVNVSAALVTDYFSSLSERRDYKPKTLHRMISTLSSFYRYLYAQGAVVANPMLGVERPRIKNQELKYLKHSQVIRLINTLESERDRLIVRLIYATGVRVSELCAINVEDIDFEEQTIRVKGKGDKIRTVFVDEGTLDEINGFIGNTIEGPLFLGQQGNHISPRTVQHLFKQCAPAGITPHKIRHSYASELYRRSKNLRVVQENLGHSSIKTTEIYLHTDLDERRNVYRQYFPLSNGKRGG
ncbi:MULTISPECIES: site-specific tyrosine recombinase/integron integrase [unclassified Methanoculleus]|uniref:site-specific tyrosine recombinase/integron integrase n=1 Tax=unclassified Methanoculleus TaxID=2619537 RepID=UPI0026009DE1|nr:MULTISPECIES: site-specific tyrosine recombinase/integron integrase [unclassified Methanoculleus]MCK9317728.1 tyrosine-type recombinase/integrase [Methanoculleus sp.]MDD2254265.1 tyrosine-type recombinase/integrase [Methanoculleus sp.]MDD2788048.1 tyrosine-type recombinase/integrase [Methanoculleus sp.]MDD3216421.1 tyrosine-type recombinase/integrase [Methanoculleus sp.]MDD4314713.1 tyrosine-type recombinase/integrase [Methanoculleus sp.]